MLTATKQPTIKSATKNGNLVICLMGANRYHCVGDTAYSFRMVRSGSCGRVIGHAMTFVDGRFVYSQSPTIWVDSSREITILETR